MKLKQFVKKLEEISKKYGDNLDVVMADGISVVKPVFSKNYKNPSVVISDEK